MALSCSWICCNLFSGNTDSQVISRPGRGNPGNCFRHIDIHIVSIEAPQDLNCGISLISQSFASPLGHPSPVPALHLVSVTVLGQDWLTYIRSGKVVFKKFIHDPVDTLKNIPAMDPFVVVCCGGCNGEIITLISVPLCINSVQSKRHDCQNIGTYRCPPAKLRRSHCWPRF